MALLKLKVVGSRGETLAASAAGEAVSLVHTAPYLEGDYIALDTDEVGLCCVVQFEDSMAPAFIYIKGREAAFHIPPAGNRPNYSPKSFTGACHLITARLATPEEMAARRNLALNPYDGRDSSGFFPHATANVETRGEAVFAARNAVDGIYENASHGVYPYQSWGINRDPNAEMTVDFGRPVLVDEVRLTLRADYPHDNYWTAATLSFSDGSSERLALARSAQPQAFPLSPRTVSAVTLGRLQMAEGPSPFPALTQIEVWGWHKEGAQ